MALRVERRRDDGLYQLVDSDRGPVRDANEFLVMIEVRGLSRRTMRAYAFDLLCLYRWLGAQRSLRELKQADLLDFIAHQRRAGAHPSSINRRLTTAGLLYRFVTGKDFGSGPGVVAPGTHYKGRGRDRRLGLHLLPAVRPRLRVKVPRTLVEPLSAVQVRAFLRSLRRYRDLAVVYLMLLCGLRSNEVLELEVRDLLLDECSLRVRGKGNRERVLPLPDVLIDIIKDYIHFERPPSCRTNRLFVVMQGRAKGRVMTPAGLRSLFRHRRKSREIANANPHRFRHTFGADMARAGVRLPVLQRMMGHADGATTLRYINLSMADVADEYRRACAQIRKRYQA